MYKTDRQKHVQELLEQFGKIPPEQKRELAQLYDVSLSMIYYDIAQILKSPTYYRLRAIHQVASENTRARKLGIKGRLTTDEWLGICEVFDNSCACCKRKSLLAIDHVVPLSKGGENTKENIQPLCNCCNQIKRTETTDYRPNWTKKG